MKKDKDDLRYLWHENDLNKANIADQNQKNWEMQILQDQIQGFLDNKDWEMREMALKLEATID